MHTYMYVRISYTHLHIYKLTYVHLCIYTFMNIDHYTYAVGVYKYKHGCEQTKKWTSTHMNTLLLDEILHRFSAASHVRKACLRMDEILHLSPASSTLTLKGCGGVSRLERHALLAGFCPLTISVHGFLTAEGAALKGHTETVHNARIPWESVRPPGD